MWVSVRFFNFKVLIFIDFFQIQKTIGPVESWV